MYIIAEIGINHNGSLETALKMIDAAKEAGANCVKFQKRNPDVCVPEHQKNQPRTFLGEEMTYLEYKKRIEFSEYDYWRIANHCKKIGIDWTVSVWDLDSVEFMKQFIDCIPFIKIPSALLTNGEVLYEVNKLNIPIIISNGMSTFEEMIKPLKYFNNITTILHCNSSYPSNPTQLDLNCIRTLKTMFPKLTIGYSGHEIGYFPTTIAVAVGAEVIERHFTLDHNMEGTDQKASLEPQEFKDMVDDLRRVEAVLGNSYLTVYPAEEAVKKKLRK